MLAGELRPDGRPRYGSRCWFAVSARC